MLSDLSLQILHGYDHITAAIIGVLRDAALRSYALPAGALPNSGVTFMTVSSLVKNSCSCLNGRSGAVTRTIEMAKAEEDWDAQWLEALDPRNGKSNRESKNAKGDSCTVCVILCAG